MKRKKERKITPPINTQVIWIVGASSGIGAALAKHYSSLGARLILSARSRDGLYHVKTTCKANPMNIHVLPLDLEKNDTLVEKTQEALRIFGRIDTVIHTAGITQRALAVETDITVAKKIMTVNYWGPVTITQALLPSMLSQGRGHIIVISSLMGKIGTQLRSSYAASKHALHGYFESLRPEIYASNIHISMVCPGFVNTSLGEKALKGNGELYLKKDDVHRNAMSVEEFVKKLSPHLAKQKEEIFIAGPEIKVIWASKFLPGKFFRKKIRESKVI
ncbi:SDR family NAD(P)-dependent oxidoreductase [Olivibacter sp. SDN3]|uniref:SDR family NAD(P)-dependent oxidoreductase n=1 Tax=Olivibacter sp. SDN3 TaxID=2764720 RepID=UPI001650F1DF|nr:SDR family NAD(P)-dependent oxidoreductase [Olivibacter sp. SDN3]QNL50795.1 SDR family NAD(P)-dependent oxidoreductase [Olivibacter sp. SDN3]